MGAQLVLQVLSQTLLEPLHSLGHSTALILANDGCDVIAEPSISLAKCMTQIFRPAPHFSCVDKCILIDDTFCQG